MKHLEKPRREELHHEETKHLSEPKSRTIGFQIIHFTRPEGERHTGWSVVEDLYRMQQVVRSCRHRRISRKHVFFGGEDQNSYAKNFAKTLSSQGWLVASVNARDAKKLRANLQAS
jgi:hypothetical protein